MQAPPGKQHGGAFLIIKKFTHTKAMDPEFIGNHGFILLPHMVQYGFAQNEY